MVESVSRFRTEATIIVPVGTRMSGPGISGSCPTSAKAATSIAGPLSASGRQVAIRTSSCELEGVAAEPAGGSAVVVGVDGRQVRVGRIPPCRTCGPEQRRSDEGCCERGRDMSHGLYKM